MSSDKYWKAEEPYWSIEVRKQMIQNLLGFYVDVKMNSESETVFGCKLSEFKS